MNENERIVNEVQTSKFWESICGHNELMDVTADLINYFRRKLRIEENKDFRHASLKDVEYQAERIDNLVHFHVNAIVLTDEGEFTFPFIAREFKSQIDLDQELEAYETLKDRTARYLDIEIPEIIKIRYDYNLIVYDEPKGTYVEYLDHNNPIIQYTLGRVCSAIHGSETLQGSSYELSQEMFKYLINLYPFKDEEKGAVMKLAEPHFTLIRDNYGGYTPASVFDVSSIKINLMEPIDRITEESIDEGRSIKAYVFVKYVAKRIYDRMEDIATEFTEQVLEEFFETGNVAETLKIMMPFLRGYQNAMIEATGMTLESVYPKGIPLDFFVTLTGLILKTNQLSELVNNQEELLNLKNDILRFIYFMLYKKPFEKALVELYK